MMVVLFVGVNCVCVMCVMDVVCVKWCEWVYKLCVCDYEVCDGVCDVM